MAYLFFQTWVWLLIAFILGLLLGGLVCWLCCKKKQQENEELKQQLTALSHENSQGHKVKTAHLSGQISNTHDTVETATDEIINDIEPEVVSMVETMVETVIQADDAPSEVLEETAVETVAETESEAQTAFNEPQTSQQVQVSQNVGQQTTETESTGTQSGSIFFTEPPSDIDDLKKIKGIGAVLQKVLNEHGIYQFKQIAAFTEKDIASVNESLSFPGRIEREQWVEQAKILSKGQTTEFSKRVEKGDVEY